MGKFFVYSYDLLRGRVGVDFNRFDWSLSLFFWFFLVYFVYFIRRIE